MKEDSLLDKCIAAVRSVPGIGYRSAQRMVYYLLRQNRAAAKALSETLIACLEKLSPCKGCRNFTEHAYCRLCSGSERNSKQLCIVEEPMDLEAIEQTKRYKGLYFVLMGRLSPLDGLGPEQLGLNDLQARLRTDSFQELILATGSTLEGEATARYIAQLPEVKGLRITRLAHGIPMGGGLEFVDLATLAYAVDERQEVLRNE